MAEITDTVVNPLEIDIGQQEEEAKTGYPTQRITETAPDPTSKTNKAAAITTTNLSSIFSLPWHTTLPPPYGP